MGLYDVGFTDLDPHIQDFIFDKASKSVELSFKRQYEDKEALSGSPQRWVPCDVTIKLNRPLIRQGVQGNLKFELKRRISADWATRYSDAERSRMSSLFEDTHTWMNITEIKFFDSHTIEFQCGENKKRTPRWFSLGFDDKFENLARQLTTLFKMEMTYSTLHERVFEIPTPTAGESFDISFETKFHDPRGQTYDNIDCDVTIQFKCPVQKSKDFAGVEVTLKRNKKDFIWSDSLLNRASNRASHYQQLSMQFVEKWKNVTKMEFSEEPYSKRGYRLMLVCGREQNEVPMWFILPHMLFEKYKDRFTSTLGFVETSDYSRIHRRIFEMNP
jgi:hypothetical protein